MKSGSSRYGYGVVLIFSTQSYAESFIIVHLSDFKKS